MKLLSFLSLLIFLSFASCVNNKKDEPIPITASECATITYSANVYPIIQQNCAISGCHVAGSPDGDYTKYADLKANVDNGSFKNSVIDGNTPVMPQTGQLTDAELRVLKCWLNNGAPNN